VGWPSGPATGGKGIALAPCAHLHGGLAHLLEDERDGAGLAVEVGDGQRDALAVLVDAHDDELPGLALRATWGTSTTMSLVTSLRTCFSRILYTPVLLLLMRVIARPAHTGERITQKRLLVKWQWRVVARPGDPANIRVTVGRHPDAAPPGHSPETPPTSA
jgi:hypothetical protein